MTLQTTLNWSSTALLLVDPQVDVLSPDGVTWDLFGEQVTKRKTVQQMTALRDQALAIGLPIFYSHIEVTEQDYAAWSSSNGLQSLMAQRSMMLSGKGSAFLPELEPTADTVLLSARKGPSSVHSDMAVQLRKRGIDTILVAGMVANLCVESHVRDATESGFRALVAGDAIATLSDEAHEATLGNLGLFATEVTTTEELLGVMREATVQR